MPKKLAPGEQLARTITVRLAPEDRARLLAVAERLGIAPMTIARRVLLLGLARLEHEGLAALEAPSAPSASTPAKGRRKA
ncbi:MAG TPA: hypothetical protein VHF22_03690 [Planctomycetota bacterium]|nr:hypothetical protein [Planctomycetota bacterium]